MPQPGAQVTQALAAIADHARQRQYGPGRNGCREPLLSWERVAEFDTFTITVRCDYNVGRESGEKPQRGSDPQ